MLRCVCVCVCGVSFKALCQDVLWDGLQNFNRLVVALLSPFEMKQDETEAFGVPTFLHSLPLHFNHQHGHQNHPLDHQNHFQDNQNRTHQQPRQGAGYLEASDGLGGDSGCPGGGSGGPSWVSEAVLGTDVRNRQCSEQCSEPTKASDGEPHTPSFWT